MQFLKGLFWCLIAFTAALFTYGNWTSVRVQLWSNVEALVNLPFMLLVTFLLGYVPTSLYNHAIRWRLRQRLAQAERAAYAPASYQPPSGPASGPAPSDPAPPAVTTADA